MPNYNKAVDTTGRQKNGYTPKGYVTEVIKGQTVNIPVSELKIIPPKGGTAAVTLKK
ncbi:MAG: hypothetical protein LBQ88_23550 [Treponema sp.]|jgi:hypothetical protein|nr:hypothetical protein [Treponema sp.]